MKDRIYEEIGDVFSKNGFDYTVYGQRTSGAVRHLHAVSSFCAVLRDSRATVFETERLADVLTYLEAKEIYLALFPAVKTIQKAWMSGGEGHTIQPNEVFACFMRKKLFQTCEDIGGLIQESLKGHFLHLQEDEEILKLDQLVEKMVKEFADFRHNAYDAKKLEESSAQLRAYYKQEGNNTLYLEDYGHYAGDYTRLGNESNMRAAAFCLELIRNGNE